MSEGNPRDFQGSPTLALMECHDTEAMMVKYRFKKYRAYEKFGYPPPPNPIPSTVSATYTQPKKPSGVRASYGNPSVSRMIFVITMAFSVQSVRLLMYENVITPDLLCSRAVPTVLGKGAKNKSSVRQKSVR